MTEEEAKTKWCPMVRARESGSNEPATNIYHDGTRRKCIASGCMMWIVTLKAGGGLREDVGHCGLIKK